MKAGDLMGESNPLDTPCITPVAPPPALILPDGVEVDHVNRVLRIAGRKLLVTGAQCSEPYISNHRHSSVRFEDGKPVFEHEQLPRPRPMPFALHFDVVAGENMHAVDIMVCPTQVTYGPASMTASPSCGAWEDHDDLTAEEVLAMIDREGNRSDPANEDEREPPFGGMWIGFEYLEEIG